MSDLEKIALTSAFTIVGGLLLLVLGQVLTKFFIDPIHDMKRYIGEVGFSLVFYADIYTNPIPHGTAQEEKRKQASEVFRREASQLRMLASAVPYYSAFEQLGWLPEIAHVNAASANLIGLSNGLVVAQVSLSHQTRTNNLWAEEVKSLLGIHSKRP